MGGEIIPNHHYYGHGQRPVFIGHARSEDRAERSNAG